MFRGSTKTLVLWVFLILLFWAIYQIVSTEHVPMPELPYSQLLRSVEEGDVRYLDVRLRHGGPAAEFRAELENGNNIRSDGILTDRLIAVLEDEGVMFNVRATPDQSGVWQSVATSWVPLIFIVALFFFFVRALQGKSPQLGDLKKSPARVVTAKDNNTRWSDVIGCDEAKRALQEVAHAVTSRSKPADGADRPMRCLLVGPPGCGKTLLARALAGEAGVPFHVAGGAQFIEMFVGVGAARVRATFEDAAKQAPAIIFIDDIDAIARRREGGTGLHGDERDQTLHQLLESLDGFAASNRSVGVVVASNRPDLLDDALIRRGRFDRRVEVPLPDVEARKTLFAHFARPRTIDPACDFAALAEATAGLSAADLASIVGDAARRADGRAIAQDDFRAALAAFRNEERLFRGSAAA